MTDAKQRQVRRAMIFAALKQLGLTQVRREIVATAVSGSFTGSLSDSEVTLEDLDAVIEHLKSRYGWRPVKASPDRRMVRARPAHRAASLASEGPDRMVSRAQDAKITALGRVIEWRSSRGLSGYCVRMTDRPWPATSEEARRIIEGLKGMRDNQIRKARAEGAALPELSDRYGLAGWAIAAILGRKDYDEQAAVGDYMAFRASVTGA